MKYSSLISKKKEYKYSANLCFDLKNEGRLSGFIPNITTTEILEEYLYGILEKTNIHSRILYGSYGTGKSHLLTVLCALLGHINTDRESYRIFSESISVFNPELSAYFDNFVANEKPFFVVPVYADHDDFDKCISYSLKKELDNKGFNICFRSYFQESLELLNNWKTGGESAQRLTTILSGLNVDISELQKGLNHFDNQCKMTFDELFRQMTYGASFVSSAGNLFDNLNITNNAISEEYQGIVFVFDEFGRYLEDLGENIRVRDIQNLAEYCDHSEYNNYLILVSHKQLSLYTEKLRKEISDEWKKVEGRFKATSINAKYDQCLSLVPHIIPKTDKWDKFKEKFASELNSLFAQACEFKGFLLPPDGKDPFVGGYPLHPITLFALDRLSKRVAQNERTFFTYLASDEENALFKQLDHMDTNEFHFVGLDLIYDYFEPNIRAYRSDEVYAIYKRLQFALNKLRDKDKNYLEQKILKTLTVINIIGDTTVLSADKETLQYVIDGCDTDIEDAIENLENLKIVKYMRQYGFYDFLDSSIYDFDSMIEDKIISITDEMVVSELNENFINFVVYPHQYNMDYHINRVFVPVFVLGQDINKKYIGKILPEYYDGALVMALDYEYSEGAYIEEASVPERSIILVNNNPSIFINEVKRYIAINYFYSIREQLKKDDPTAEKELEVYLDEQRGIVSDYVKQWKALNLSCVISYVNGKQIKVTSEEELSNYASEIMYASFNKTIIVNSDMINKNKISGTIRFSRQKVIAAIIGEKGGIGEFTPMSPEHTIIRSVLYKNGFGTEENIGELNTFPAKSLFKGELSGVYVQNEIRNFLRKSIKAPRSFSELYVILKSEPYGLRDGYIAILLADELKNYENVAIYFHGMEKDFSSDEIINAVDKSEDYKIYICNWSKEQSEYIERLELVFAENLCSSPKNRLKELYSAMNLHFSSIPKIARATDKYVSPLTVKYRRIMSITQKDYNKFFFEELPSIEQDLLSLAEIIRGIKEELEGVLTLQIKNVKKILRDYLKLSDVEPINTDLINKYNGEWALKRSRSFDYQTNAFLDYIRIIDSENTDDEISVEIAKILAGFEIDYWSDSTLESFENALKNVLSQINDFDASCVKREDEIQIIVKFGGENALQTSFNKTEMSINGQTMLKKLRTTMEGFGESISHQEKMAILTQLLSES